MSIALQRTERMLAESRKRDKALRLRAAREKAARNSDKAARLRDNAARKREAREQVSRKRVVSKPSKKYSAEMLARAKEMARKHGSVKEYDAKKAAAAKKRK